jgi:hypothetical protein
MTVTDSATVSASPISLICPITQPRAAKAQVQNRPLRPAVEQPVADRR